MLALTLGLLTTLAPIGAPPEHPIAPPALADDDRRRCFLAAYPGLVCAADDAAIHLCPDAPIAHPGAAIPWDDGRAKTHAERLAAPDLEDTVAQRYRPGAAEPAPPPLDFEPGRVRELTFLGALYGATRDAVAARTVTVDWMPRSGGGPLTVTAVAGVAQALARVSADLERELPADLRALVARSAGAFVWRTVRGSDRRSAHSYAIAVDVGLQRADYWDWNRPGPDGRYRYKNRFPLEVVAIFERHGFIWGGRWYHFDTMHFEYRPELLVAPCVDGPSPLATPAGAPHSDHRP